MTLDEVIAETRGRPCSLSDDAVIISHESGNSVTIRIDALTPEAIQTALFALDANAYPEREKRFMDACWRLMEQYA